VAGFENEVHEKEVLWKPHQNNIMQWAGWFFSEDHLVPECLKGS
jgi:hypothetical protein